MRELAAELCVPWTPGAFVTGTPVDQEMDRGYSFNYINNTGMRKQLEALIAAAEDANAAGGNYPVPRTNPALANTVKERIIAGYVSNTWKWDRFSIRSEEHTSELQSLMRISYAVFCLKKKNKK